MLGNWLLTSKKDVMKMVGDCVNLKDSVGKEIRVIFDDGAKITQRVGILANFDDIYLYVDTEAIPHIKVVRWEVLKND